MIEQGGILQGYHLTPGTIDEWNTLDLICLNGKSPHMVNKEVVMVLKNSRYINKKSETVPLTKGKIQLLSEAAELFFKGIKNKPSEKLSPGHLAFFQV